LFIGGAPAAAASATSRGCHRRRQMSSIALIRKLKAIYYFSNSTGEEFCQQQLQLLWRQVSEY